MKDYLNKLSSEVIGAAIEVHRDLGPGLLETTYEVSLQHELKLRIHSAQLLTYLRMSNKSIGLLLNFHNVRLKDGIKRLVHNFPS